MNGTGSIQNTTKMTKKYPNSGANISINFKNKKPKRTVHPNTFLEFTSVVFSYVDYWMSGVNLNFSSFFVPPPKKYVYF